MRKPRLLDLFCGAPEREGGGVSPASNPDPRWQTIAEQALRDITRCDYRGNEPPEQLIARLALAEIARVRKTDEDHVEIATCQRCGAYWDPLLYKRCPSCGGYLG